MSGFEARKEHAQFTGVPIDHHSQLHVDELPVDLLKKTHALMGIQKQKCEYANAVAKAEHLSEEAIQMQSMEVRARADFEFELEYD